MAFPLFLMFIADPAETKSKSCRVCLSSFTRGFGSQIRPLFLFWWRLHLFLVLDLTLAELSCVAPVSSWSYGPWWSLMNLNTGPRFCFFFAPVVIFKKRSLHIFKRIWCYLCPNIKLAFWIKPVWLTDNNLSHSLDGKTCVKRELAGNDFAGPFWFLC